MIRDKTEEAPAASVIVPLYNGVEHIEQAITSVLSQCGVGANLELIVVDDGSTDCSADMARRLIEGDERARVVSFPNGGVAAARNRGLSLARGRYVAFLDQDDTWYPGKLDRQVSLLDAQPDVAFVGCLMDYMGQRGQRLGRTSQTPTSINRQLVKQGRLVPFPMSSALFRAEPLRQLGGSRDLFGKGMATAADIEVMALSASLGEIVCIRETLGGYRIHRGSVTARSHNTQMIALQYLQAVLAQPGFEAHTSWTDFQASFRPGFQIRRMTKTVYHYRQAGLEALERRWLRGATHLARAAAMSPVYTFRRLYMQLGGR